MVIKILNKEREEREPKQTNQVFSSPSSFQQQQRPPLKKTKQKNIY
jgi:hypothetical protein